MSNQRYVVKESYEVPTASIEIASEHTRRNNGTIGIAKDIVLSEIDTRNRNGRIYPKKSFVNAYERHRALVEAQKSIGELDHPLSDDVSRNSVVQLENASNLISRAYWDGNLLRGDCEFYDTPKGAIAFNIAKRSPIGVSSRGMGELIKESAGVIVEDYFLVCWDTVSNPSVTKSVIQLSENTSAQTQGGISSIREQVEFNRNRTLPNIAKMLQLANQLGLV